jgi:hypothetical protein
MKLAFILALLAVALTIAAPHVSRAIECYDSSSDSCVGCTDDCLEPAVADVRTLNY